jgi:hypothetical protein
LLAWISATIIGLIAPIRVASAVIVAMKVNVSIEKIIAII